MMNFTRDTPTTEIEVAERHLMTHADNLKRIASLNHSSNHDKYMLGQLYYNITKDTGLSYEMIDTYMVATHGIQLPSGGSMSRLRSVYETWHLHAGVEIDELAFVSPYLLYQLQNLTIITGTSSIDWLGKLRTHTREQVLEAALGIRPKPESEKPKLQSVTVSKDVVALMNDARAHFAKAVGEVVISPTAFLEFTSQLILDSNPINLRSIWAKMHGEATE
jgi:hypothetical protein